jgi:hypothetical protein
MILPFSPSHFKVPSISELAKPGSRVLTPFVFSNEQAFRGLGGAVTMPVSGKVSMSGESAKIGYNQPNNQLR